MESKEFIDELNKVQDLLSQEKYSEAIKIKIESNRILEGFNSEIVAAHFKLFR